MSKKSILKDVKYVLEEVDPSEHIDRLIEKFNSGNTTKENFIANIKNVFSNASPLDDTKEDILREIDKRTDVDPTKIHPNADTILRDTRPPDKSPEEILAEKRAEGQAIADQEAAKIREAKNQHLTELFIAGAVMIAGIVYMERRIHNFNKKAKREFKEETKELQDKAQVVWNYDGLNDAAGAVVYAIYANTDYMIEDALKDKEKKDFYYVIYSGLEYSRENFFKDNKNHPFLKDLKSDRLFRETDILVKRKKDIHKEVHYLLTKRSKITEKEFNSVLTNSDRSIKKINKIREQYFKNKN